MKTLIRDVKDLDGEGLRGRRLVVRVAGRPELYAEVSRRSVNRLFAALQTAFMWVDPDVVQGGLVLEIDAGYRSEIEGSVIG